MGTRDRLHPPREAGEEPTVTRCIMCRTPFTADQQRVQGFCPTCWETEKALTDEAIARAAKVLKSLSGEPHRIPNLN